MANQSVVFYSSNPSFTSKLPSLWFEGRIVVDMIDLLPIILQQNCSQLFFSSNFLIKIISLPLIAFKYGWLNAPRPFVRLDLRYSLTPFIPFWITRLLNYRLLRWFWPYLLSNVSCPFPKLCYLNYDFLGAMYFKFLFLTYFRNFVLLITRYSIRN